MLTQVRLAKSKTTGKHRRWCSATRPPEQTYCYDCGRQLGPEVLPSNDQGFKETGLPIDSSRVVLRQDRVNERPLRTWGDRVSRIYLNASLITAGLLWASSQGWLPRFLWDGFRSALMALILR
jgi:hypothetical protein